MIKSPPYWNKVIDIAKGFEEMYTVFKEASRAKIPDLKRWIDDNAHLLGEDGYLTEDLPANQGQRLVFTDIKGRKHTIPVVSARPWGSGRDSTTMKTWTYLQFPYSQTRKLMQARLENLKELKAFQQQEIFGEDRDLRKSFIRYVNTLKNVLKEIASLMNDTYPVRFKYLGFDVYNPQHFSRYTTKYMLEGIESLVQVFKKRHMLPALQDSLKRIILQYDSHLTTSNAAAYYDKSDREISLFLVKPEDREEGHFGDWVVEITIHEFAHHIYYAELDRGAKEFWDSGWDAVYQAIQKDKQNKRSINLPVTKEDKSNFYDLLMKHKFDYKAVDSFLEGKEQIKYRHWLTDPTPGDFYPEDPALSWDKNAVVLTPHAKRLSKFLMDKQDWITNWQINHADDPLFSAQMLEQEAQRAYIEQFNRYMNMLGFGHYQFKSHPIIHPEDLNEETEEDKAKAEIGLPTSYAGKNPSEDFAETLVAFLLKPERLSKYALYRIQRTLSLSNLYGKPIIQLAKKLALKGHSDLALQILEVYAGKRTVPSPVSPKEAAKEAIADYFLSPDGLIYPLDYGSHEEMSQALRWKFYQREMEAGSLYTIEEKNWVSAHDYVFDVTFMRDKKLTQKQQDTLFDIFLEARKEYKENKNLPSYKRHNLLEMIRSLVSPEAQKLGLHLEKAYKKFEKETKLAMSSASRKDIEDAIDHLEGVLDIRDSVLSIDLFDIKNVPNFDYSQTEDDFGSWAEWDDGELEDLDEEELMDELIGFRGRSFAQQAMKWIKTDKWPPIVVVDTDIFYEICDGRGRTSVAIGIGKKTLPATIISLKKGLSLKSISQVIDDLEPENTKPAWPITAKGIKNSEIFLKGKPYLQGNLPIDDLDHMRLHLLNATCSRHLNGCLPYILDLVQEIKRKRPLPPIVVYKDGPYYRVMDGNHRIAAAILAGKRSVPALIQL